MAMRKPRPASQLRSNPDTRPDGEDWTPPILRRTLAVQKDGSVRIPASVVRLVAAAGEELTVTFFADGHLELDGEAGRAAPPLPPAGARVHEDDEAFVASLESRRPEA